MPDRSSPELATVDRPPRALFAGREAEAGPVRHEHATVDRLQTLVEQGIQPLEMLDPRFARIRGREVQVDLHREVRSELKTVVVGKRRQLEERRDAADPWRVRLDDV